MFNFFSRHKKGKDAVVLEGGTTSSYVHVFTSTSSEQNADCSLLLDRITLAYKRSHNRGSPEDVSMWKQFFDKNIEIHNAILCGMDVTRHLNNPVENNMFYGFDNLCFDVTNSMKNNQFPPGSGAVIANLIFLLAEAVGVKRYPYPGHTAALKIETVEDLLTKISTQIGAEIDFPNPFAFEIGLPTSRGIASYRAIQAIYQAWRIKELAEIYGPRVVEIGAGLGRTAYYAHKFGVQDYTIIDLPFTNLSQANFLGRVLSADRIRLYGEEPTDAAVKIFPPSAYEDLQFEVLANVDSLTEMGPKATHQYMQKFYQTGRVFWSVNHEVNPETVSGLASLKGRRIGRFPYWLREGYVEEIFV